MKINNKFKESKKLKLGEGVALSKKNLRNFNKGNVEIEDKLDLHGYTEIEAKKKLKKFIFKCINKKKRLVLVITGKGFRGEGVIKNNIINWLNENELRNMILAINYASMKHGGEGAIYIFLKKN